MANSNACRGRRSPSRPIHQWEFEESINRIRRRADEDRVRRHWSTTGRPRIDAAARAHVAEWRAVDRNSGRGRKPATVVDACIERAFAGAVWDLYVIEDRGGVTSVRRLRDGDGVRIRWIEGRSPPPAGTTVGLRVVPLETLGFDAATRPVVFGGPEASRELISSLLRAFGQRPEAGWTRFMRGIGSRIVLEHGLSHLQQCAEATATTTPRVTRARRAA